MFEIVLTEPNPGNAPADPMPADLVTALANEIKKASPKKSGVTYRVEKADKK